MENNDTPLVSCLCVTKGRIHMLKRAIACFESQTYANCELIVLVEIDDDDTVAYMSKKEVVKLESSWSKITT